MTSVSCPPYAPFLGFAGVAAAVSLAIAMVFSTVGAAYGTSKAGIGISGMGTLRPDLIMKSLIPVVMAGIIAVYGLVVSVLIIGALSPDEPYSLFAGFIHLAAGLSCGLTGLAAGHAIGIVGDALWFSCSAILTPRFNTYHSSRAEVIGLYGLIVALILNTRAGEGTCY
ncbi:V-type H+-transporting ATPase 16kDa proteolipid subunit, partial [Phenoliferia sp. Uapishka_3]